MFVEVADFNAPWLRKKIRGHDAPYMTNELRELMGERDKMKTLTSKTNDPDFFLKY